MCYSPERFRPVSSIIFFIYDGINCPTTTMKEWGAGGRGGGGRGGGSPGPLPLISHCLQRTNSAIPLALRCHLGSFSYMLLSLLGWRRSFVIPKTSRFCCNLLALMHILQSDSPLRESYYIPWSLYIFCVTYKKKLITVSYWPEAFKTL